MLEEQDRRQFQPGRLRGKTSRSPGHVTPATANGKQSVKHCPDPGSHRRHCAAGIALIEAHSLTRSDGRGRPFSCTCGRGGTGRRAALRSLWPKGRGSSSLLDRTSMQSRAVSGIARLHASKSHRGCADCRYGSAAATASQQHKYRKVVLGDYCADATCGLRLGWIVPVRATGLSSLTVAWICRSWSRPATSAESLDTRMR